MLTGMRASGWMARALVLVAVATIIAPHPAFAESGVAIEDFIKVAAAVTPAPGVSKRSNQKIGMVVATLKDILQSVVNEEAEETSIFNKYSKWCKTEQDNLATDLSESKRASEDSKVLSEEQISSIDGLKLFIANSEKEIEQTRDAMSQADSLRNQEKEQYTEDMQINKQSLGQIDAAIKHLSKLHQQGGFLQSSAKQKLQISLPGESSYVMGVMKGLKEKLVKTRASLKSVDEEKDKMHTSFMKTKGESLKVLTDTTTEKKIALTETKAKQAGVQRKIGKLTEEVAQLTGSSSKTAETCEKSQQEWKVRQEDRANEKTALSEAVRYLTQTALQQFSLVQHQPEHDSNDEVFPLSFLETAASSRNSDAAFDEVAHRAFKGMVEDTDDVKEHMQKDAFNGVKDIVSKLISTHEDTQHEEKTKKSYCEDEIASREDERTETADALGAVKADIEKKASEVDMLADEVKSLYASIDKMRTGLEEARRIRKQEAAVFQTGSKDRALALKVLKQAKGVLQKFYEDKVSLKQAPAPRQWAPRKKTASFGAVSMVEDIADDIAKEQKDATIQEAEASDVFEALQADSQDTTDSKQQDITDRVIAKAKLKVQINTQKETQTENADDLKAITQQLTSLHKECDELLSNFGKRKKDRAFEVSQLRDVMDILSGSSVASRTSFLQAA